MAVLSLPEFNPTEHLGLLKTQGSPDVFKKENVFVSIE